MRQFRGLMMLAILVMATATQGCRTAPPEAAKDNASLRLGFVLTNTDPETVFNAFRLANYAVDNGDTVSVFLLGKAVELDQINDAKFDVQGVAKDFLGKGGNIMACGTCLKLRDSEGSELCPRSTLKDLHELVRGSDRVVTF
jgi:sulfur relay (sulfurtransferase) complex TusBCD TusD component (DsrE family)